jgi:3HB-oligomer hydrolase 3HBOH
MNKLRAAAVATALAASPATAGATGFGNVPLAEIERLSNASVRCTDYDGITDDLLTAGLGKSGLAGGAPPVADPANPTPAELRRLAIYSKYRALVDITSGGGYGALYGPNVLADGTVTSNEGLIPGTECLTYADDGSGRKNVTLMVQVPASFDPSHPCIVTGPSSGSRGIYGAIATSGEWGLKNGCAVAYTDKGTGVGAHDLQDDTVGLIDGVRESADFAGKASNFTARISDSERAAFNAETPNRFAFKHAHSEQNPEAEWGVNVLQAILFAFIQLDRHYPKAAISPANTIVIGSSVSNGGGASVRAAEIDHFDLIDGIAVSEPNVDPPRGEQFAIVQGDRRPYLGGGKPLYDYTTQLAVFQGCANLSQPEAPFNILPAFLNTNRCASLRTKGLLTADTLAEQAAEAQAIINGYGLLPEQNIVQPSHWTSFVPQAVAVTYADTYARARVQDNLCGYSFGATDSIGTPIPLARTAEALLFGTANKYPADRRHQCHQQQIRRRPEAGYALGLTFDGLPRPEPGRRPLPALVMAGRRRRNRRTPGWQTAAGAQATAAQHRPDRDDRRPEAHTRHRRRRPLGRGLAAKPHIPRLLRPEPANRRGREPIELHRGDQRAASRCLQCLARLRYALHPSALLPDPGTRSHVCAPEERHAAAAEPGAHTTPRGGTPGSAPPISAANNLPPIKLSPAAVDRIRFSADTLSIPE